MVPPPSPRPWAPAAIGGATKANVLARRSGAGVYEQPLASKPISVLLAIIGCCVLSCCLSMSSTQSPWRLRFLEFWGDTISHAIAVGSVQDIDDNELDEIAVHTMEIYLINSFGMMGIYVIIIIMNFIFRVNFYDDGTCVIGQSRFVLIPLIAFDAFINIYLTILFLIPLLRLYSVHLKVRRPYTLVLHSAKMAYTAPNLRLRRLAFRTFVGTCCTLASSVTNMTVLMILNGESSWLCFIACNSDVLFSALVIQWVTASDQTGSKNRECLPKVPPATSAATAVSSGTTGRQSGGKCEELQAVSSLVLDETPDIRPRLRRRYSVP
ncbi:hypothetical protein PspLS_03459 [Pyricularia sp. CBS 133598]|nr:hypothetical protein PspLS_03459 [Pyricularia sp. CBS 133598]